MSKRFVISLGGSVLVSPSPNLEYIKALSTILLALRDEGFELGVVVGGGQLARDYIRLAREFGADEEFCDRIGIATTRMNAMLLLAALGEGAVGVAEDFDFHKTDRDKILVMGGLKPGQTTDAVAAELAARRNADLLINATNVDGVYDKDPKLNKDAKRFDRLSFDELLKIVSKEHVAGHKTVLDPLAASIIRDKKIKLIVLDGRIPENIEKAVRGEKVKGTLVS